MSVESLARDHALEIVWIGMILLFMIAPLWMILIKLCQRILCPRDFSSSESLTTRSHHEEALRDFMVGSAVLPTNRHERMELRKGFLESRLTTFYVKEESDDVETATCSSTDICKLKKGDLILSPTLPLTDNEEEKESHNDDTNSQPMCAICVSPYQVGDKICWSNNPQCHHCFHKACIQQWLLLFHTECPCCRLSFLVVQDDDKDGSKKKSNPRGGDNILVPTAHRNSRFTREGEAAFQRMIENLRNNSYRSLLSSSSPSLSSANNNTTSSTRQRREEDYTTTMDTSGRTEAVLADQDHHHDLIYHQHHHQEPQERLDNAEDDEVYSSEFVEIELGIQDESNHDDDDDVSHQQNHSCSSTIREESPHC